MTIHILNRGYGSTNVGGDLACPKCGSKSLKRLDSIGITDIYQCQNPMTNIKTGAWRICGVKTRYVRTPMRSDLPQSVLKANPAIATGQDPRYEKAPSYRKVKLL